MKNKPLVSVLIPSYNHEKYIEETILSVIGQSYANIELILLDDGSQDSTFSIATSYEEKCKSRFVRYIFETKTNEGTAITLNTLANKANGEYIFFIASDDVLEPNGIQRLVEEIQEESCVACLGDNQIIDSDSKRISFDKTKNGVPFGTGFNTFAEFLLSSREDVNNTNFGTFTTLLKGNYFPNGMLIKKSVFLETGGYTKKAPLEDWYLNLQLSKIGKIKFIQEVLYSYRWHDSNTVKNRIHMQMMSNKTLKYELSNNYSEQVQKSLDLIQIFSKEQFINHFNILYNDWSYLEMLKMNYYFILIYHTSIKYKIFHLLAQKKTLLCIFKLFRSFNQKGKR